MYNPENPNYAAVTAGDKPKKKKEMVRFSVKTREIREEREERIEDLVKDILAFLAKNKIDDRDAKVALYRTSKVIAARCEITK